MVPDASGAIEFLLDTAAGKRLAARLADETEVVHVPYLIDIDIDIDQMLRRYVLHGTLNERLGALALNRWRNLDVERYPHEPFLDRTWQLRDSVTAYDAICVALAEALSAVLVTGDRRLADPPGANAPIELIWRSPDFPFSITPRTAGARPSRRSVGACAG